VAAVTSPSTASTAVLIHVEEVKHTVGAEAAVADCDAPLMAEAAATRRVLSLDDEARQPSRLAPAATIRLPSTPTPVSG